MYWILSIILCLLRINVTKSFLCDNSFLLVEDNRYSNFYVNIFLWIFYIVDFFLSNGFCWKMFGIYFQPKRGTVRLFRGLSRGRSPSDNPRKSLTVPSLGWKYNILFHRQFRWEGRFLYTFPRCRWKSIKTFTHSGGKYIKTFPLSEVRSKIKFHWKI